MELQALPTDTLFQDSPDSGPNCICSRCQKPIVDNMPIRLFVEGGRGGEYRYHPTCVGLPDIPLIGDGEDWYDDDEDWGPEIVCRFCSATALEGYCIESPDGQHHGD